MQQRNINGHFGMSCTYLFWLAHDDTLENNFFENSFPARAHSGVNYAEKEAGKINAHLHARDSPRDACQTSLTRGSVSNPLVYLSRDYFLCSLVQHTPYFLPNYLLELYFQACVWSSPLGVTSCI